MAGGFSTFGLAQDRMAYEALLAISVSRARHPIVRRSPPPKGIQDSPNREKRWQPYAGLVYFHLLLAGLAESGEMPRDIVERAS